MTALLITLASTFGGLAALKGIMVEFVHPRWIVKTSGDRDYSGRTLGVVIKRKWRDEGYSDRNVIRVARLDPSSEDFDEQFVEATFNAKQLAKRMNRLERKR